MEPDLLIVLIRDLEPKITKHEATVILSFDEPDQAVLFYKSLLDAIRLSVADDEPEEA